MPGPRLGFVSPMTLIVPDINDAFTALWPEAEVVHVVDDSVYNDFIAGGRQMTDDIKDRVTSLLDQCAKGKPDAMMFTGSVFGEPIAALRPRYPMPLLAAFDGIVGAAFEAGTRFGIIATSKFSLADLTRDLDAYAKAHGIAHSVVGEVREDARKVILVDKDREKHDAMIAETAATMTDVDAILLAQFSLSLAYHKIEKRPGRQVLTLARTSVDAMRRAAAA